MRTSYWLGLLLFSLSADLLRLNLGSGHLKLAYFLIPMLWLKAPNRMLRDSLAVLSTFPLWPLMGLLPLGISVLLSSSIPSSVVWVLWFGFDLFTTVTVFARLRADHAKSSEIREGALIALALMAVFGIAQFLAFFFLDMQIFQPQVNGGITRLNGLSGWPHFLNIYSFMVLPLVLSATLWGKRERLILVAIFFVLVQSTAKTGWVLFIALGILLFFLNRNVFQKKFLKFCLPIVVLLILVPAPGPLNAKHQTVERLSTMAKDLNYENYGSGKDRLLINLMGMKVFLKHPWFGVGPRAYRAYVENSFDQEMPGESKLDVTGSVNTRNENIWVELLSETGSLFTGFFALLIFFCLRALKNVAWSPLAKAAAISLLLYYGVGGLFSQNILLTLPFAVWGIFLYTFHIQEA